MLESGNGAVIDLNNDGIADGTDNTDGIVTGVVLPVEVDADLQSACLDVDSDSDGLFNIVAKRHRRSLRRRSRWSALLW